MRRDYSSLRRGLVGAWCPSLGATGYTLLDRSGMNLHGTLTNMAGQANWLTDGSGKLSLSLDAFNDYVEIPAKARQYPNRFAASLSCWVRFSTLATRPYSTIFETLEPSAQGGQSSYQFTPMIKNNGKLAFYVYNTYASQSSYDGTGAFTLAANTWYSLAFVFVGGVSQQGFVNGVLDGSVASPVASIAASTATQVLRIGYSQFGTDRYYGGQLDDIRLYSRALTRHEIRLLASQRGIGLTPVRQRRTSASSRRLYANVSGTWKETVPMVNVGGTWKEAAVYQNVGGVWKN